MLEQQEEFLAHLARGASPMAACARLGVPCSAYLETVRQDSEFQARVAEVRALLSQNVVAALYRAAMEGSVPAQTFWLKASPPPEWTASVQGDESDPLDRLSDEQALQLARVVGLAVAADAPHPAPAADQ